MINWEFVKGALWFWMVLAVGMANNAYTNGEYAHWFYIVLMMLFLYIGIKNIWNKPKEIKEKKK